MSARRGAKGRADDGAKAPADADGGGRLRVFAVTLGEVARLWRGRIDRQLKPLGLSFMQWSTLSQLSRVGEDVVQKDLASLVGIEGPAMVGVLDRLVEAALVERRVAAHDRRANTVHLTGRGRKMLDAAETELRKLREGLLEGVSEADLATGIRVLERIAGRAKFL